MQSFAQTNNQSNFPLEKIPNLPSNFYLTKLQNGLQVLVIEDHTVPLATIELVVRNGAFVQTPDLEGLAHLYEHMFFKANKDYPSQEAFLERINELGIVFNGTTSEERVNYFVTLSRDKVQDGLQFMNSSARYPKFLKSEMEKENVVVAGEFQRNESNPIFYLFQDMNRHLWGNEFSRKNTIGRYEVILNATPEIMQNIKNRYYYPNNSMLVIAGDVAHDDIFPRVQSIYGNWKPSTFDIFQKYPIPEFPAIKYSQNFVTENANTRVPFVMMGWQGPDTRHDLPSTYAADVFSFILSQQSSKLQKALVETGLAYQVSVNYSTLRYTGPIQIIMVPNPAKMKEAMQVLTEQISHWADSDYFTDDQLATAKEMLEIDDQYSKEQVSQYVHTVTYWWASASLDYYANYINNIKKVTRDDITNYVNTYILSKPHVTGVLTSPMMSQMTNLESFFKPTANIDSLMLTASGKKTVAFDSAADQTITSLAYLLQQQSPDVKVKVRVHAPSDKIAAARIEEMKKQFKAKGIAANRIQTSSVVKSDKELSEEEKKHQNTITFSF